MQVFALIGGDLRTLFLPPIQRALLALCRAVDKLLTVAGIERRRKRNKDCITQPSMKVGTVIAKGILNETRTVMHTSTALAKKIMDVNGIRSEATPSADVGDLKRRKQPRSSAYQLFMDEVEADLQPPSNRRAGAVDHCFLRRQEEHTHLGRGS